MPSAGVSRARIGPYQNEDAPAPISSPIQDAYQLYNTSVGQQAGDYDRIQSGYDDLIARLKSSSSTMAAPQTYTPKTTQYSQSKDLTDAISNLKGLADTGGYSESDKYNLRERAISPIRSIYSSAIRNVDRNRALSGGYSPNYNAVIAKMAREQSAQTGDAITGVNADLAQKVAANRLQIAPTYSNVAGQQSDLRNNINRENTGVVNDAYKFNIETPLKYQQMKSNLDLGIGDALRGKTSLYGTTPALAQLYGQQANTQAGMQQNANQQRNQNSIGLINSYTRG